MDLFKCKMKDPSDFQDKVLYHIVQKQFVCVCPHCKQKIFAYIDPLDMKIKWNDIVGDQMPIGGLIKPYPQNLRPSNKLINLYKKDEYMFYREKVTPDGFVNFTTEEMANSYIRKILVPNRFPFNPAVYTDKEETLKREEEIERLAKEEYVVIPVWVPKNLEYMFTGDTSKNLYRTDPNYEVVVTSDLFITLQATKNL